MGVARTNPRLVRGGKMIKFIYEKLHRNSKNKTIPYCIFVCDYCYKEIEIRYSIVKKTKNQFCCRDCKDKWQNKNLIGNQNPFYNRHHTYETKTKLSKLRIGRKFPKLSEAKKGHILTKEHKLKLSKAMMGRKFSETTIKKLKKANLGKNNPMWQGGYTYNKDRYLMKREVSHPCCDNQKRVFVHRLVMEKYLGRYLKPEEVVHHINRKRDDNRIENLMLFANQIEHMQYHKILKDVYKKQ
jgi:hypothetical protein